MIRCMPGILVIRHLIMQLSLNPKVSWLARIPFGMETFHSPRKNLGYVHTIPDRFSVRLGNRSDTMWTVLGEIEPDRNGLEFSCSHHIGSIFVLVSQKQTYPRLQESDNEIPFQKQGRSAEQVVHISRGAFQNAIRYGTYHFWNRSVPARNRHRNCAGTVGSNVNRRPIRYCFRIAPIIKGGQVCTL